MMRLPSAVLALALLSGAAAAQTPVPAIGAELSGSVGLATDYAFRGLSQTQRDPALQANLELLHGAGFYIGGFASNVDFPDAKLELDALAGYRFRLGGVAVDVGAAYYAYPGAADRFSYDWYEAILKASYAIDPVTLSGMVGYTPRFQADAGTGVYLEAGVDVALPLEVTLALRGGYQWIERNDRFGVPDYATWSVGVSRELFGLTATLAYIDTDIEKRRCGNTSNCDARAVFSVTKKF